MGPFTSHDSLSNYIAQALYAVFIVLALILLVNMMIAVLSSTYERVEVCLRLCTDVCTICTNETSASALGNLCVFSHKIIMALQASRQVPHHLLWTICFLI